MRLTAKTIPDGAALIRPTGSLFVGQIRSLCRHPARPVAPARPAASSSRYSRYARQAVMVRRRFR
ncbi:hypothetical protein AUA35_09885 [Salmonella enterica subsp. enterica serovar Worthington]|uniref:Uncharacterized protein n=3 Tax=Salmonella enterica TaxID=28901 RepID=A0A5T3ZIB2_SALER|nr:hypothetical protein A9G52_02900 [Salmonella enterica subsp. enterica serovar Worthington]EAA0439344.1 hypothetical protein [Salmonella enterica]EAA8323796.1 hypothetical protein [Salmonella enterica subsp. enterica]EBV8192608.1 hypothetical protein [Salmonella enterica subsp. enterica serovar Derby]ECS2867032.1 hypothetical protein [Salmonella enterica subsp. enterica serovar Farmsen]ECZ8887998.1 hypothetical protein [Salmonella enterica subsp. enterica serovar Muenster]EDE4800232.1 hypot